ncbi:MAG: SDR family oxidoreductase [Gallionellaceae bacterium]|jgi:nucleoside-diphosphate-sugar epimerase|nr:SDR family oxidoreductase [Gallionellaceae bacterium]
MNRITLIGCGDIALRVAALLRGRYRLYGLARNEAKFPALRAAGITPIFGDLDGRASLKRIAGLADTILHFAPPAADANGHDRRTRNLLAALNSSLPPRGGGVGRGGFLRHPARLIYISTSGVYGDCGGDLIAETRPPRPQTSRAALRLDAEQQIRAWAQRNNVHAAILRVPGIYAADRLPLERLRSGTPAITANEDSYVNHIHADDLAHIVIAALHRSGANRIYHASDDGEMKMGDYFDAVADAHGLARPPRMSREEVKRNVSPMLWSFMNESRRMVNERMKRELNVKLRYPTVQDALSNARRLGGA